MGKIITVPFGWLLSFLYDLTNNYGVALILFATLVQLILLPITAKSKKSMMKMSRIQPKIQKIQEKYADDKQKQNEAIQQLQKEEGATMGCGGCLWSFVPLLILIPLYTIIREPLSNLLGASNEVMTEIANILGANTKDGYWQIAAAQAIYEDPSRFAAIPGITEQTLQGINFSFLNLNLGAQPVFNVFKWSAWDWAHIGLFLIPVLSAGQQVVAMLVSQRANNSVITDENGMEDKETAKKSQSNQSSKVMMWMMPAMSLWIGFTVPAGLSIYWFVGGVLRMVEDIFLTKHYRKIYDAEDAERLKKHLEEEAIEAEKERLRAEKRAANPDGITENTSKKKLQKKQQQAEEAAKAAAKREYDAKRGIVTEEAPENQALSGIPERPFCKGRAYDPNRYGSSTTEE
jgi:YidC/Oxa1 family membrane protein insertase